MKALSCPHCQTQVAEDANVCRGCGAEVVRGATRRERSLIGFAFVIAAIPLFGIAWRAFQLSRGSSPMPSGSDSTALLIVVAMLGFFVAAYVLGRSVAGRLFRRSQVRFFRVYRHQ